MQELDLQCPYKVSKIKGVTHYVFITNNGSVYKVAFDLFSPNEKMYSFSLEKIVGWELYDPFIKDTIIAICKHFFLNNENSIFYLCDISDGRQKARQKLFHRWFLSDKFHLQLIKIDEEISVDDVLYYISMIYHKENPNSLLINEFYNENIENLKQK